MLLRPLPRERVSKSRTATVNGFRWRVAVSRAGSTHGFSDRILHSLAMPDTDCCCSRARGNSSRQGLQVCSAVTNAGAVAGLAGREIDQHFIAPFDKTWGQYQTHNASPVAGFHYKSLREVWLIIMSGKSCANNRARSVLFPHREYGLNILVSLRSFREHKTCRRRQLRKVRNS